MTAVGLVVLVLRIYLFALLYLISRHQ